MAVAVAVVTAGLGFCPLYTRLGLNTGAPAGKPTSGKSIRAAAPVLGGVVLPVASKSPLRGYRERIGTTTDGATGGIRR